MKEKRFRPWNIDQQWLLPPSIHDFVPEGHLAHFVRDTVRESLDLSSIVEEYREARGYPPYHPVMMTALLLYAYCQGIYSSRRIARACEERVDFMAVTGMQKPDFRTVSDFRRRHLSALGELFAQVLHLCRQVGLVKLGHVALDGTKVKANASRHKAMSYGRMKKAEKQLLEEVNGWFEQAEAVDEEEDERHGSDRRGDEMPAWVADKQQRLAKIREAKAALEEEARAVEQTKKDGKPGSKSAGLPRRKRGPRPKTPRVPGEPKESAQRNFTDPDSRIMKTTHGFEQCFNAQAAVDEHNQVIVARGVTNNASDQKQLQPMVSQMVELLETAPRELSADADYCSEVNLEELERREIRGYVATGRQKHDVPHASGDLPASVGTRRARMRTRLKRGGWRSRYRLRKQTVEPVFGQIKAARNFGHFFLRGIDKVTQEWSLICTAHNLLKLAAACEPTK
jgi:transposase